MLRKQLPDLMDASTQGNLSKSNIHLLPTTKKRGAVSLRRVPVIVSEYYTYVVYVGGGYCNFMHLKHVSKDLKKEVRKLMYCEFPQYKCDRDR